MAEQPRYEPYLDLPMGTFRWRLGLRPLDLTDWLQYDEHAEAELAYKRQLLNSHPDTVFVVEDEPDVTEAGEEILGAVLAVAPSQWHVERDVLHPLDAAGRMVQEDLVLMVERDGSLVCGGGSVCFPNRWDLQSKVGRTMSQIHQPVPDLNRQIGDAVDRSLDRLSPDRAFWRLGWTIVGSPELYQPVDGTAPEIEDAVPEQHWLRVERETLRKFPHTGAVLFTIRTYLTRLDSLSPVSRRHIAGALDAMSDDILDYKALTGSRGRNGHGLIEWLGSAT